MNDIVGLNDIRDAQMKMPCDISFEKRYDDTEFADIYLTSQGKK